MTNITLIQLRLSFQGSQSFWDWHRKNLEIDRNISIFKNEAKIIEYLMN